MKNVRVDNPSNIKVIPVDEKRSFVSELEMISRVNMYEKVLEQSFVPIDLAKLFQKCFFIISSINDLYGSITFTKHTAIFHFDNKTVFSDGCHLNLNHDSIDKFNEFTISFRYMKFLSLVFTKDLYVSVNDVDNPDVIKLSSVDYNCIVKPLKLV